MFAQRVNFEYEFIVGEDCSTDGTREALNNLRRRYPGRIVPVFRERNVGAMKKSARHASRLPRAVCGHSGRS